MSTGVVSLPPRFGAAIESYVYDVAKILSRRGHIVDLIADTNDSFDIPGVAVHTVGSGTDRYLEPVPLRAARRPFAGALTSRATFKLLSLTSSDRTVILLNEEVSGAIIARGLRGRPNIRCVFVLHDPPPDLGLIRGAFAESSVRRLAWELTRIGILSEVSAVVALNPRVSDYVTSKGGVPSESCFSLPLAIDTDLFEPKTIPREGDECRLVYVGRIDSRKNVGLLIRAMEMVGRGTTLRLVGDGPLRKPLEKWVSDHHLDRQVHFLGVVSSEELRTVLQTSDAFVLPSSLEVFPRAALEAAACGLPLILPNSPHYSQYFAAGCAQGFGDFNPTSIHDAIGSLFQSRDRAKELGIAARLFAVSFCGYDAIGRGLESIFDYCFRRV